MTALLLVHGRQQQMRKDLRRTPEAVARHATGKRRKWLGGLAKGLTLAGEAVPDPATAYFPFYGNLLEERIAAHEGAGGGRPDLEGTTAAREERLVLTTADMLIDAAESAGFVASEHMLDEAREDLDAVREAEEARREGNEAGWSDALKWSVSRSALQWLADKTDTPEWIIERHLRDVAYYLEDEAMRDEVHETIATSLDQLRADGHEDVVVVGHSLGSVVAYDLCDRIPDGLGVRLLVTAGAPLGLPVVRRNLWGGQEGDDTRGVPRVIQPVDPPARRGRVWWLNAYDVADAVAMIHPLAPRFTDGAQKLRDERTHNPTHPHAIEDYLADPDVAGPIAHALTVSG